jgi:hypothetical protein
MSSRPKMMLFVVAAMTADRHHLWSLTPTPPNPPPRAQKREIHAEAGRVRSDVEGLVRTSEARARELDAAVRAQVGSHCHRAARAARVCRARCMHCGMPCRAFACACARQLSPTSYALLLRRRFVWLSRVGRGKQRRQGCRRCGDVVTCARLLQPRTLRPDAVPWRCALANIKTCDRPHPQLAVDLYERDAAARRVGEQLGADLALAQRTAASAAAQHAELMRREQALRAREEALVAQQTVGAFHPPSTHLPPTFRPPSAHLPRRAGKPTRSRS